MPSSQAIRYHLSANHFPPIDRMFDAPALRAIAKVQELREEYEDDTRGYTLALHAGKIKMPDTRVPREEGRKYRMYPLVRIMNELHLWDFLDEGEE